MGSCLHIISPAKPQFDMGFPNKQHQHHLGTCKKCKLSSPTPRPTESETSERGPAIWFNKQALQVIPGCTDV